jgi:hypothetical protein
MAVTSSYSTIAFRALLLGVFAVSLNASPIINLSTYTNAWFVYLGGDNGQIVSGQAVHNNPFTGPSGSGITLSFSNAVGSVSGSGNPGTGTAIAPYIEGSSPQSFTGIWYLDARFDLPADAYNVTLTLNNLSSDDRAQVFLNEFPDPTHLDGTTDSVIPLVTQYRTSSFSGTGNFGHELVTKNCSIRYYAPPDNSTPCISDETDVTYNPLPGGGSSFTSGFNIGGENHLRIYINNVGCPGSSGGYSDGDCANLGSIQIFPSESSERDGTWVQMDAVVSYSLPAPEPATYAIMGTGLLALFGWRRLRR